MERSCTWAGHTVFFNQQHLVFHTGIKQVDLRDNVFNLYLGGAVLI
jgi:hypothetical protein